MPHPNFILHTQVTCTKGEPMGFEIEGGCDTPLKYTYIKAMIPNTPAWSHGIFRDGDQLVMIGNECLIGLTNAEARQVLENADGELEIVAQRKESPRQTPTSTPTASTNEVRSSSQMAMRSRSDSVSSVGSYRSRSSSIDGGSMLQVGQGLDTSYNRGSGQGRSQQGSELDLKEYLAKHEKAASLVPEETHTIVLKKTAKQKLGLAVVGGIDNPNLKEVHVSQWVCLCDGWAWLTSGG